MRVVYRSILREISEIKAAAAKTDSQIERIELSPSEMQRLRAEVAPYLLFTPGPKDEAVVCSVLGISVVEVEDLPLTKCMAS